MRPHVKTFFLSFYQLDHLTPPPTRYAAQQKQKVETMVKRKQVDAVNYGTTAKLFN
jgi:hypothetical protein